MAIRNVRVDPVAAANLLRSPQGDVMRNLARVAVRVRDRARQKVGKRSRQLERSIVTRIDTSAPGWRVIAQTPYAVFHHEGTRPHRIEGKPLLVFHWPKAGRVVFLRSVNHPGTKPTKFLTEALTEILREGV